MEAARGAVSSMDGCGVAGDAQGIFNGSNFVATSLQLRINFAATSLDLACARPKRLLRGATRVDFAESWSRSDFG